MKEKMYDFGKLGKWSEGTLKEQIIKVPRYDNFLGKEIIKYKVEIIENKKKELETEAEITYSLISRPKVLLKNPDWFWERMARFILEVSEKEKLRDQLYEDYLKYSEVVKELGKKKWMKTQKQKTQNA